MRSSLLVWFAAAWRVALTAQKLGAWPGDESCGGPFEAGPAFHLMNQHGCGENDPNGPVFDPVHGVIHHFYQDHIATPGGRGPVYGHFVSKDFVHWASMPVAIWNGIDSSVWPPRETPYDSEAIYTGSAVVVDGAGPGGEGPGIVQIYPGLCQKDKWSQCTTGTLLCQAVPADYASDELLTNWTKPSYNPIIEGTQRDPATPWKTPDGEWRLRTFDRKFYGVASDADMLQGKWYEIGVGEDFRMAECPSFYPLPGPTPGFEEAYRRASEAGAGLPTHVSKVSAGGDWWQLGTYSPGAPRTTGCFNATPGWEDLFESRKFDQGPFYASKDSEYPTKEGGKRRINWGWAVVPPEGVQTLPRVVTFNAEARTLEQAPIEELEALREAPAASRRGVNVPAHSTVDLKVGPNASRQGEIAAVFDLPSVPATFGVKVGQDASAAAAAAAGGASAASGDNYGAGTDVPPTSRWIMCNVSYTPPANSSLPFHEVPVACLGDGQLPGGCTGQDVLRILPNEKTITLRIFLDHTFLEAFFQQGRVAMLSIVDLNLPDPVVALTSTADITVQSVDVYPMRSIWTTADAVRNSPRVFPKSSSATAASLEGLLV